MYIFFQALYISLINLYIATAMEYYNTVMTTPLLDCSLLGDHPATGEGMNLEAAVVCCPVDMAAEKLARLAAQTFGHPEQMGAEVDRLVTIHRYNSGEACFH
jgi:hypothetical protein